LISQHNNKRESKKEKKKNCKKKIRRAVKTTNSPTYIVLKGEETITGLKLSILSLGTYLQESLDPLYRLT
jgi:hypothetical protein